MSKIWEYNKFMFGVVASSMGYGNLYKMAHFKMPKLPEHLQCLNEKMGKDMGKETNNDQCLQNRRLTPEYYLGWAEVDQKVILSKYQHNFQGLLLLGAISTLAPNWWWISGSMIVLGLARQAMLRHEYYSVDEKVVEWMGDSEPLINYLTNPTNDRLRNYYSDNYFNKHFWLGLISDTPTNMNRIYRLLDLS